MSISFLITLQQLMEKKEASALRILVKIAVLGGVSGKRGNNKGMGYLARPSPVMRCFKGDFLTSSD
jgi:hypothetical protein